ncbi:MAG TPA: ABC transporter permease [Acidobacteriaceae bacterium]|jgi:predicted permease|nr:ABC transporter permease [Acidobacteriaceae bacterium]
MILREARRFLRSSPLLSLSGIMVLALGIGASALALALLLAFSTMGYPGMRTLGYATIAEEVEGGGSMRIAWRRFEELRASPMQGAALAAYSKPASVTMEVHGESRPLKLAAISSGFFSIFTPRLAAGRDFSSVEEGQAGSHVVILSHSLAVKLFQSPENALNRFVRIEGLPFEVVGVAPSGFHGMFGDSVEAWVPANCEIPLIFQASLPKGVPPDIWKAVASFYGVAASRQASSKGLAAELAHSLPLHATTEATLHASQGLTTDPVRDAKLRKWLRLGLLLALVFTIVSSLNYGLLLLARTPRYAEEIRLKKALGAGSRRLMMELMIGPAAMVGAGVFGACLFCAGGWMLLSRMPGFYGQLVQGSWHAAFLAFGVQVLFACGLTMMIALLPALGLLRDDGAPRMGYTSTTTRRTGFLLQITVTLQIVFCIGTWILAGMIVSSLLSLMREPLGYDASHLSVVAIGPGPNGVQFSTALGQSFPTATAIDSLLEQVDALPGVRSASLASDAPFEEGMSTVALQRLDHTSGSPQTVNDMTLTPGYFHTMGTRIIRGRDLSSRTLTGNVNEIVLNASLARELWSKQDPLHRSVRLTYAAGSGIPSFSEVATVVGVVEDMRMSGFMGSPEPTIFMLLKGGDATPRVIVNGSESIRSLQAVVSRQVPGLMPGLVVRSAYRVEDQARASLHPEKVRVTSALAGALLMALLACIGLYGSLAYYVGTRRRELAVRICFGATPWRIRKIILERAAGCAVSAGILSAPLWLILAKLSSNDYLGRISWSTGHAVLITLACIVVAVLVSLVPATAAAAVSPSEVLKEQ